VAAVDAADFSAPEAAHASVVATMKELLPADELQFLMELSIEPVAAALGRLTLEEAGSAAAAR
jgi:hypothetical protein